jgi:hypothetical protein
VDISTLRNTTQNETKATTCNRVAKVDYPHTKGKAY